VNSSTHPAVAAPDHVDAYCATGTSPGRTGRISVSIPTIYGGELTTRIGFESRGSSHGAPVVVLGGISAGRHLFPTAAAPEPGWWPGIVEVGGALDPNRNRLIGVDFIGAPGGEVGFDHPISTFDQARALAAVLDALDLERVTLVGSSYGGMVALAFAALFPLRTERLVVFCAAHRSHPMATALRSIQRETVRFADEVGRPAVGLSLARSLAMTTYRSTVEFDARFDGVPVVENGVARFPVESYLSARGEQFAKSFDPPAFLALSESLDLHAVTPADIFATTTVVSFDTDTLVPPWLVEELAAGAPGVVDHIELCSAFGHDAFLKDVESVSDVLREALGHGECVCARC
jgi:homoserine O-acetyltransferase